MELAQGSIVSAKIRFDAIGLWYMPWILGAVGAVTGVNALVISIWF